MPSPPATWEEWKNLAEAIEAFATVASLVVAAVWAYLVFVRGRQKYPRAKLRFDAALKPLSDTTDLLHVVVFIENAGDVLLRLVGADARVDQLLPLNAQAVRRENESEIRWPPLDRCTTKWNDAPYEIEPGETENIHFDFVVPARPQTLEVYTHFANESKRGRDIGWDLTVLYDVQDEGTKRKLVALTGV